MFPCRLSGHFSFDLTDSLSGTCGARFTLAATWLRKFNRSTVRSKSIIGIMSQELLRILLGSPSTWDFHVQRGKDSTPPVSSTIRQTTRALRARSWLWLHSIVSLKNFSVVTSATSHSCGYYCADFRTSAAVLLTLMYAFKDSLAINTTKDVHPFLQLQPLIEKKNKNPANEF